MPIPMELQVFESMGSIRAGMVKVRLHLNVHLITLQLNEINYNYKMKVSFHILYLDYCKPEIESKK